MRFAINPLVGQIRLSDARRVEPSPHLERRTQGTLQIESVGPVRVTPITAPSGDGLGVVVGDAIDLDAGRRVAGAIEAPEAPLDAVVDSLYRRLAGTFLIVTSLPEARRAYLDCIGGMPLVYSPDRQLAGSTTGMILDESDYVARFDRRLFEDLGILGQGWFPAGLTAHRGVYRLLPNHYLDLDSWTTQRHWPDGPIDERDDPDEVCRSISGEVYKQIEALLELGPIAMALTGGGDSRAVLSSIRSLASRLDFVTIDARTGTSDRDVAIASTLAKRFGLRHTVIEPTFATSDQEHEWLYRTGHCVGDQNRRLHPTVRPMDHYAFFVGGLGGEIGGGFLWRDGDGPDDTIDPGLLESRFGNPRSPAVHDAIAEWLRSTEGFDAYATLDLAYLELRMGCWGSPQNHATLWERTFHPLMTRRCFEAMYALPVDWRRHGRATRRIVELAWPELLEVPINSRGVVRDALDLLRRTLLHPELVVRKLRKAGRI